MGDFREEYEKKYAPMRAAMEPVVGEEHDRLVELCQRNCWIKRHGLAFSADPCLEADSPYTFCRFGDIAMLKLFFEHGNWSIRQGYYTGICFSAIRSMAGMNGGRAGMTMWRVLISRLRASRLGR